MKSSHHFFIAHEAMVSLTSVSSLTSPVHSVPSTAARGLLPINKPNAAGFPEATGWTSQEGAEVCCHESPGCALANSWLLWELPLLPAPERMNLSDFLPVIQLILTGLKSLRLSEVRFLLVCLQRSHQV